MAINSLSQLTPDPHNRRAHTPRNLEMLRAALAKVGAARSIVIDEDGGILAGNGLVAAASSMGLDKVTVVDVEGDTIVAVRRSGLTADEKRDLAIYDNRTAELAEWNWDQLAADQRAGLPLEAWWTKEELELPTVPGRTDPDEVPPERPTDIQRGDLFELGAHRLLCGDSTLGGGVASSMDGSLADLVFTSPPYGQQRVYGAAIVDWDALMQGVFANVPGHDTTQVLVNLGLIHGESEWHPYWEGWIAWMRQQGWRRFGWYVWDQGFGLPGDWNGRLAPSFEFVFQFNRAAVRVSKWVAKQPGSIKGRNAGTKILRDRGDGKHTIDNPSATTQPTKIPDSVIRVLRQQGAAVPGADHPAVFSVGFAEFILRTFSLPGGIELEPRYCQVIVDRWEAFTGQRAVKVGDARP